MDWNTYVTTHALTKIAGAGMFIGKQLDKIPGRKVAVGTMALYGGYKGVQAGQEKLYQHRQRKMQQLQMKLQQMALKNQAYGMTHHG